MYKIICIILSLTSTFAYGNCDKPVYSLSKGEQAPCAGYLFSPEKELEVRVINEKYKLVKEEILLHNQKVELYKEQVSIMNSILEKEIQKSNLWRTTAEENTLKLVSYQERASWRDWLFLGAGIILTVSAGYAVGAASK